MKLHKISTVLWTSPTIKKLVATFAGSVVGAFVFVISSLMLYPFYKYQLLEVLSTHQLNHMVALYMIIGGVYGLAWRGDEK